MRRIIACFKMSIDGRIEGEQGFADWVDAWSEDFGLGTTIDACLLGGGMYPGYEGYWTAIASAEGSPLPMTGKAPSQREIAWSEFAAKTPHFVLSNSQQSAAWSNTHFLRSLDDVRDLKALEGKSIYLMGGAKITASLLDEGLVDELRLIVHPVIVGKGKHLFLDNQRRQNFRLVDVEHRDGGLVAVTYRLD